MLLSERKQLNFQLAYEAIFYNRFRSMLTALGIIFGVAAVIAMLAIGNGAKQEILDQIKLVGVNNIVIKPVTEKQEGKTGDDEQGKKEKKKYSPGLTLKDVESIEEVLPGISNISPEIEMETQFVRNGMSKSGKLVGVLPAYFEVTGFVLSEGEMFNKHNLDYGDQVCIIGNSVRMKFFNAENAIGKYIKCGNNWLKVIGVMQQKSISESNIKNLGIRDYNADIYTPLQTVLIRYKNRSKVTEADIKGAGGAFVMIIEGDESSSDKDDNLNQLDRIVVQVDNAEHMLSSSEVISKMLLRRHYNVTDFEISVPELLLKQQQRTKDIFNIVLGVIAGISLLVGGIGIMNIMLASVLERIKEIGIRLSMGATKTDIVQQFLFEAILISVSGGVIGIVLGITLSVIISQVADIKTIVSLWSVVLSFGVAGITGLVFGITPAKRAAQLDPIQSLRYE